MKSSRFRSRAYVVGPTLALILAVVLSTVTAVGAGQSAPLLSPTSFVDIANHQIRYSGTGTFDWANGPDGAGACTNVSGTISCPGTNGIFNGGKFNGATTPPTAPGRTSAAAANSALVASAFVVDPLSVDVNVPCANGAGTVTGDPSVFTGAGSETNGDNLSTMTWGSGSVPNKDEVANVYAAAHRATGVYEVFFGGERVVNNGDSHMDFEFLQSTVALTGTCSGSFSGHRTQGDMLLAVDFTNGGTLGGNTLYVWHCAAEGTTQPPVGTQCDPPTHGQSVPHYQSTGSSAVNFGVNAGGAISCGGWACRNADGTLATQEAANEFMEGGIDLQQLGFTGCISTFLPHTRSAQSFTATLKDFAGPIPFNTCFHPTITTNLSSTSVSVGTAVHDSATLNGASANAGGTVNYSVYTDNACSTGKIDAGTVNVTNGAVPDSNAITFNSTGTFYWQAVYSGDNASGGTNFGATSACTTEVLTVTKVQPAINTSPQPPSGPNDVVGTTLNDKATLSNGFSPTGTITFKLFDPTQTCPGDTPRYSQSVTVNGNGDYATSPGFVTDKVGTWKWIASYSGDNNNLGASSGCNDEQVTILSVSTILKKSVAFSMQLNYTYKETNDGQAALTNPSVADPQCVALGGTVAGIPKSNVDSHNIGDTNGNGILDPGETWQFNCSVTVTNPGTYANTAVGHGTDPLNRDVTYCTTATTGELCDTDEQDTTSVNISVTQGKP